MGVLLKYIGFIVVLTTVWNLGLGAENLTFVENDDDDSVVIEARSFPSSGSRSGRQIHHIDPVNWFQAFGEGSGCLTSTGELGSCTKFRSCYPEIRNFNFLLKQKWVSNSPWILQNQEVCNFYDEYGQQTSGVCCIDSSEEAPNPETGAAEEDSDEEMPTGTGSYEDEYQPPQPIDNDVNYYPTGQEHNDQSGQEFAESGEQYQYDWPSQPAAFPSAAASQWPPPLPTHGPSISQWPPPVPTHPPNHHYPTHPPHPGLPTLPPATVTSARPTYPTYRPTQRPMYPSYTTTNKPPPKPPTEHPGSQVARCGAKNGISPDQERIVGGQNSSPHEWPWVVVLFNKGKQFCGGSLIDSMHILTAAHCVARMTSWDVAGLTAHLGDHNIRTSFEVKHEERKIKRLVRHKGFDFSTLHNDVAVLTLDRPVSFTREIRPICLPHSAVRKSFTGQVATVAGWGSLREGGPQPSVLQKVNIPIWANNECARKYGRAAPGGIIESMICAGQAAKDSCSGDSGGPLMVSDGGHWTQIGIVSWGIGCGKGQYPGVYTRVTAFLPWITKNLK